jgi:hypothetical protein
MLCWMAGGGSAAHSGGGGAGLIPGPTHESVFAMGAHGRVFTLVLQQSEGELPLRCSAVSEKSPFR